MPVSAWRHHNNPGPRTQRPPRRVHRASATMPSAGHAAAVPEQAPPSPRALPADGALEEPLTDKEARILELVAQGKSNKQIAATVFLAEGTVKNYVSRIMDKLHARTRTELAVRAVHRRSS